MANRRLLGEFLVASPLIMLLGISIEARTSAPMFEPYSYTNEQQAQVLAYRPYLIEAVSAIQSRDRGRIRQAGQNWIEALESKNLTVLKKANYFDSARAGAKGEIAQTFDQLACELGRIAQKRFASGDVDEALNDIELAIQLSGAQKYVDLETIGYFAMRERNTFEIVGENMHLLRKAHVGRMLKMLQKIDTANESVRQCSAAADRLYAIDGLRWNEARSRILDPLAKNQLISNSGRRSVNQFSITSLSRPLFDQANSMRFAISSLEIEKKGLVAIRHALVERLRVLDSITESK